MSINKKLNSIGRDNIGLEYLGRIYESQLYVDEIIKSKEMFQIGSEYEQSFNSQNFGTVAVCDIPPTEIAVRNMCLKVVLTCNASSLPACWGYNLIDELRVNIPGDNTPREKSGLANFIQCIREIDDKEKQKNFIALGGDAKVTFTGEAVAYIHLNVLCSSLNCNVSRWFPVHLLHRSVRLNIKLKKDTEIKTAGTIAIKSFDIVWERAGVLNPDKSLKSKNELYKLPWYETYDYDFQNVTNALTTPHRVKLDSVDAGEYDQLMLYVNKNADRDTNLAPFLGRDFTNVEYKMSGTKVMDSFGQLNKLKELWRREYASEYNIGGTTYYYFPIYLSAIPYVKQLEEKMYAQGADLSNENNIITFSLADNDAHNLHVIATTKMMYVFKNGLCTRLR